MRVWPILIDSQPSCLGSAPERSLLATLLGHLTVFEHLRDAVAEMTPNPMTILAPSGADGEYASRIATTCPGVRVIYTAREIWDLLGGYEISDVLLVVDPRCLPMQQAEFGTLMSCFSVEQQVAHHLVAFESGIAGTKEQVNVDSSGHVRSIHRFYEPATWPFVAGVAASLVPMSSGAFCDTGLPASLADLRHQLMARGVSSRDVPIGSGAFDLAREQGLLAANEQWIVAEAPAPGRPLLVGSSHHIDATARLLGPVTIHAGAVLKENATIVGPALIGPGATVEAGALVAHAHIGAGRTVPARAIVRDHAWFTDIAPDERHTANDRALPFSERLTRLTYETRDRDIRAEVGASPSTYVRVKRVLDVVAAAIGLVVLSPFLALIGVVVKLDSRGPMFYGGEREGVGGRIFKCWKFRTMRTDAHAVQHQFKAIDKMDGPHFKLDRDPRVTRIGRILRTTNLDELPQLYNILLGHMSLVGPRPSPFRENQICVPWRNARLSVRPGITGLWQVCRQDRSLGDFHQWIEYDLLYVQQMSLVLDLKILLATVLTLGGKIPVRASWMVRSQPAAPDLWLERPTVVHGARTAASRPASKDSGRSQSSDYAASVRSA